MTEPAIPLGKSFRSFDAEGRLTEEVQGDFVIRNTYDANGNRISRETGLGNTVEYAFDALDQAVSIRINWNEPIEIKRDAVGRIAGEQLSPQLSRSLSYNADGYLTEQAVTANELSIFATEYSYDAAGNLTERKDSRYGTDTFRYDPMGRIVEHLDPRQQLTRYLNDPAGDRLRTGVVGSRYGGVDDATEDEKAPRQRTNGYAKADTKAHATALTGSEIWWNGGTGNAICGWSGMPTSGWLKAMQVTRSPATGMIRWGGGCSKKPMGDVLYSTGTAMPGGRGYGCRLCRT